MLSLIEVEWSVIIEKHLGPLRVKFNTKQTPLNLSEVESKFIEKRHVTQVSIDSQRQRGRKNHDNGLRLLACIFEAVTERVFGATNEFHPSNS